MTEWLATCLLLLKNRDAVKELAGGGISKIFGSKTTIAITGMQGVGKTVLLDHLTGKQYTKKGKEISYTYSPPHQSQKHEESRVKEAKKRIYLTSIPGQDAEPRHVAMDKLFQSKAPVDGVIHVVANGFARLRTETAKRALVQHRAINSIQQYQDHQRANELEDLSETCHAIRDAHKKHHKPKWLIVAVDQVDLYQDKVLAARDYYSPESANSDFARMIQELRAQVGSDFFRWDHSIPIAAFLDAFQWNGLAAEPQINEQERDAYLVQFLGILKSYCV